MDDVALVDERARAAVGVRTTTSRAQAAVLTVDGPVPGHRGREFRAYRFRPHHPVAQTSRHPLPDADLVTPTARALPWPAVRAAVEASSVPVVVKGVLGAADARTAVEVGAAAVWVSNHGGRQLDGVPATLDVLAAVVDAVAGRAEVYVDGGVKRGTDVAIALALGARAVFLGRPVGWGLVVDGEAGAAWVLRQLSRESGNALALLGVSRPGDLGRDRVGRR